MTRLAEIVWEIEGEARVAVEFCLDGAGQAEIGTGHNTLDHLLASFARYGKFDIKLSTEGDGVLHHVFEHAGTALGHAISQCLESREDLEQFSRECVLMDDTFADVVLDVNPGHGRFSFQGYPNLVGIASHHDGVETYCYVNVLETMALSGRMNVRVLDFSSSDIHHAIEALYKSLAVAIHKASRLSEAPIKRLSKTLV